MKKTVKTIDENDQVSVILGISRQIYERSFLQSVYIEIYMSAEKQFHQLFITYRHNFQFNIVKIRSGLLFNYCNNLGTILHIITYKKIF